MAISLVAELHQCLRITVLLISYCAFIANGECQFSSEWVGQWFQSGTSRPVQINRTSISTKGECILTQGDKYIIKDKNENCSRCVAIHVNHKNVLQYKETFCDTKSETLQLCYQIPGDAQLFSMFRVNSQPEHCPFKGPFQFTYSRGYTECKSPISNIDTCTEDSRMVLRFQACPDVKGTESTVEELICYASWKDGSTRYLIGKLEHPRTSSDEEKYRCFVYEKNTESDHAGFKLAQSGDATCNGLSSPIEGSRTMKLNKTFYITKCHFPSWIVHSHHWHTLDGQKQYNFTKKNNTLHISNTDRKLETRILCHEEVFSKDKTSTVVTHVTTGCKNGYMCMVFHKRGHHVIEIQTGQLVANKEEACHPPHFEKATSEYVTLITPAPKANQCPYLGKYNFLNAKWQFRHEREICQGFSSLRVGCDSVDTIEFETDCPTEPKIETYECHAHWHENGTNFLITSVKGTKHRYCFVYTENDKILQFSSLKESCKRNIQPGVAGIMVFNVTSNGHCGDSTDGTLSVHEVYIYPIFSTMFVVMMFLLG